MSKLSELEMDTVKSAVTSAYNLAPGKTATVGGLTLEQANRIKQRIEYRNTYGAFDTKYHQYAVTVIKWLDDVSHTYTVQLEKVES